MTKFQSISKSQAMHVFLDLALVLCNKPLNYRPPYDISNSDFTSKDLCRLALEFVKQRHPYASESDLQVAKEVVERGFRDKVDLMSFDGPVLSGCYYEREQFLQDLIYFRFRKIIEDSFLPLLMQEKKDSADARIVETWFSEIMSNKERDFYTLPQRTIYLDMEEFFRQYRKRYNEVRGFALDKSRVLGTLIKARLAYQVNDDRLCPFWFTARDYYRSYFLNMIDSQN